MVENSDENTSPHVTVLAVTLLKWRAEWTCRAAG
jgi:hypothetical protein